MESLGRSEAKIASRIIGRGSVSLIRVRSTDMSKLGTASLRTLYSAIRERRCICERSASISLTVGVAQPQAAKVSKADTVKFSFIELVNWCCEVTFTSLVVDGMATQASASTIHFFSRICGGDLLFTSERPCFRPKMAQKSTRGYGDQSISPLPSAQH